MRRLLARLFGYLADRQRIRQQARRERRDARIAARRRASENATIISLQRELDSLRLFHERERTTEREQWEGERAEFRRRIAQLVSDSDLQARRIAMLAEIVERERERIAAETAIFSQQIAAAAFGAGVGGVGQQPNQVQPQQWPPYRMG